MSAPTLRPGSIVRGPTLPEPVEVLALVPLGESIKIIGRGLQTGLTHDPVLTPEQLARLTGSADQEPFGSDKGGQISQIRGQREFSAKIHAVPCPRSLFGFLLVHLLQGP